MNPAELRHRAREAFDAAVLAADPQRSLRRAIETHGLPEPDPGGRAVILAVGKAAIPMAREALRHLPATAPRRCLVVTNAENSVASPDLGKEVQVIIGGHPVPDGGSLLAGKAVIALLESCGAKDKVIALVSGGGSALLTAPAASISLADKAETNRIMLAGGMDIRQINLVRQCLSRLKGGQFVALADPAPVTAFILSDVIGNDISTIASGLTAPPIGDRRKAIEILQAKGLWDHIPDRVRQHLLLGPSPDTAKARATTNIVIGSNRQSCDAAVARLGSNARIVSDEMIGDVGEAAASMIREAARYPYDLPGCLVWGGETTVKVQGTGTGGRNQELALRFAMLAEGQLKDRPWAFLSAGTDGRDGPTDAAGGIVDPTSLSRMRHAGIDPSTALANNDSHAALTASVDLLMTGATGTNVADLQILILGPCESARVADATSAK